MPEGCEPLRLTSMSESPQFNLNDVFDKTVFAAGSSVQNYGDRCYAPWRHRFREKNFPAASALFSAATAGVLPFPFPFRPAVEQPRCNQSLPPVSAQCRDR